MERERDILERERDKSTDRGESGDFGEAGIPPRCSAASQTVMEAQPAWVGGRSLAQPSQRGSTLPGHLGCPTHPPLLLLCPPFQPAAP